MLQQTLFDESGLDIHAEAWIILFAKDLDQRKYQSARNDGLWAISGLLWD